MRGMDRQFGVYRFWTSRIEDRDEGWAGLNLHRQEGEQTAVAARVIFWDACGQWYVETLNGDAPVEIIEDLIAEAKALIEIS